MLLVENIFEKYLPEVEASLNYVLERLGRGQHSLREPIEYALFSGGKRVRPLLVFIVANCIGKGYDVSESALALELVHTSTLIADDLPCMDDDDERRNRPSLHVAFGEATALLTSYALISLSYDCLRRNARVFRDKEGSEAADLVYDLVVENLTLNTGAAGVLGGQHEDLFMENRSPENVLEMLRKKTGALFELTFVSAWLFGGGDPSLIPILKQIAINFGFIFQVKDDVLDFDEDLNNKDQKINYAVLFGKEKAEIFLKETFEKTLSLLKKLQVDTSELLVVLEFLMHRDV